MDLTACALACRFACLVEYVEQPLAKVPPGIHAVLSKVPCSRYILQMDLANIEAEPTALTAQTAVSSRGAMQAALAPSKFPGKQAQGAKLYADGKDSHHTPGLIAPPTAAFSPRKGMQQLPYTANSVAEEDDPRGHVEAAIAADGMKLTVCLQIDNYGARCPFPSCGHENECELRTHAL